jgi:hypothetical protein
MTRWKEVETSERAIVFALLWEFVWLVALGLDGMGLVV